MLEVDEFKEIFHLPLLPHEDEYETLSGFVMVSLGRVPQAISKSWTWTGAGWIRCSSQHCRSVLPPLKKATEKNSDCLAAYL
jgi:CBS domain containing-hemolysin-like protein